MDAAWWQTYSAEVNRSFSGERWSVAHVPGVRRARFKRHCLNSGAGAIALAALFGVSRIFLLGYDAQHTAGRAHWHEDHPKKLANAGVVAEWPAQFAELRSWLDSRVDVINLSRETALTCFRRGSVEAYLSEGRAA